MTSLLRRLIVLTSFVLSPLAGTATGQDLGALQLKQHYTAGKPTMQVYVLGAASGNGIWRVNQDITFLELLSLAQPQGVGIVSQTVVQKTRIDLYRTENSRRRLVYTQDLHEVLRGEAPSPVVQAEDLIILEQSTRARRRITFQTVTSTIGTSAGLVLLYLRLRNGR